MTDQFFEWERILQLAAFAFAATWTPGPNNILLTNSAVRFGFMRTTPHALGVSLGFAFMAFLISLGLGELFQNSPLFREGLRWIGAAVLLYLGWRIASAPASIAEDGAPPGADRRRPFTFLEAAGFQWINPKAWAIAIGVGATFLIGDAPVLEALCVGAVFAIAGLTSAHGWAAFGVGIRGLLSTPTRLRGFNVIMGALVAGCVVMLFLE